MLTELSLKLKWICLYKNCHIYVTYMDKYTMYFNEDDLNIQYANGYNT